MEQKKYKWLEIIVGLKKTPTDNNLYVQELINKIIRLIKVDYVIIRIISRNNNCISLEIFIGGIDIGLVEKDLKRFFERLDIKDLGPFLYNSEGALYVIDAGIKIDGFLERIYKEMHEFNEHITSYYLYNINEAGIERRINKLSVFEAEKIDFVKKYFRNNVLEYYDKLKEKDSWDEVIKDEYLNKNEKAERFFEVKDIFLRIEKLKKNKKEIDIKDIVENYSYENIVKKSILIRMHKIEEENDILGEKIPVYFDTESDEIHNYINSVISKRKGVNYNVYLLSGKEVKLLKEYKKVYR
jgi:hypothetical protein